MKFSYCLSALCAFCFIISGCSGGLDYPVTPVSDTTPAQAIVESSHTHLWGYYNLYFDIESMTVKAEPDRSVMYAVNVNSILNKKPLMLGFVVKGVIGTAQATEVDVEVRLTHPFPGLPQYNGYDVRGILIGNGSAVMNHNSKLVHPVRGVDQYLRNPDGYTRWWNKPEFTSPGLFGYTPGKYGNLKTGGTATLNGYKYFTDGLSALGDAYDYLVANSASNGIFSSGSSNTRKYLISFPNPGIRYDYAVLANWQGETSQDHPSNAPEAVAFKVDVTDDIYYVSPTDNGGKLILDISMIVWKDAPDSIIIQSTVLSSPYTLTSSEMQPVDSGANWKKWHVEIPANHITGSQDNEFCVIARYNSYNYSNPFGVPNLTGGDPLEAYARYPLNVAGNPSGNLLWVKRAVGTNGCISTGITVLMDNSTVVTGYFVGEGRFGEGEANETIINSMDDNADMFLARYNSNGTLAWVTKAVSTKGCGVTTLSDNSIMVCGILAGSLVVFGQGEPNETILYNQIPTGFIAHYNPDGTFDWVKCTAYAEINSIAALSDDSIVTTGCFPYTLVFGKGEPNEVELNSAGWSDIFIARYDPDGTLAWAKRAGGSAFFGDNSLGITALPDDSQVITGFFNDSAVFGDGDPNETILNAAEDSQDIFVARYNSDGTLAWAKRAGGSMSDQGRAVTVLSDNSTVVTGGFSSASAVFGPGEPNEIVLNSFQYLLDIFIARYNPDGTLMWAKFAAGKGNEICRGITALSDNSTVVTGVFMSECTFGQGEQNQTTLTSTSEGQEFLIARYNPDGTFAWAKRSDSTGDVYGKNIIALSDDSTIATGGYLENVIFGLGEPHETMLNSIGIECNIFIGRFAP